MKRFAVLMAVFGLSLSNAALADDPAFCKSMCVSEQRECRAEVQPGLDKEASSQSRLPDSNPMTAGARNDIRSQDARALDSAGYQNRRMERMGSCDTKYQRCVRACAAPADMEQSIKAAKAAKAAKAGKTAPSN